MSYVVCVPTAISSLPFLVGYGICMSLVDIDTFCPWPPLPDDVIHNSRARAPGPAHT